MDTRNAMEPYGHALLDFYYGGEDSPVLIIRDDGYRDEMSVRQYFRTREKFSEIEKKALNECKGKIVDLSAGVGADCLELQNRKFDVTAVEVCPEACEIMRKRGVKKVFCMDLFDFNESGYDTIFLFNRSIGNVQNLEGLERFLEQAKKFLAPRGQIIFDSVDIRYTDNPAHLAYQRRNIDMGKYFGEIIVRFEYKSIIGPNFGLLHVDPDIVQTYCNKTGWKCNIIYSDEEGNYLAKLSLFE
ncbi:MAG: methyltransferase domain-containing protein [Candidatus Lokiarchaeota archaeon]|nr:methyltransferase domain-containing protein [Candidatus Lokiarchaeota archaeon]